MINDTKASNENTNRHRIAIHYTGYSECSVINIILCSIALQANNQLVIIVLS